MRRYQVKVTPRVEAQLQEHLGYLLLVKQNAQAYFAVSTDYEDTLKVLETLAGSIKPCDEPKLAKRNLRRIHFKHHDYVLLYRLEGDEAIVAYMFHTLQDYANKIR